MKDVPGFEGRYAASNEGHIWSHITQRYLRESYDSDGYLKVSLVDCNKKRYSATVHRLVLTTYVPKPTPQHEVHHIDHNKENNRLSNLKWVTKQENISEKVAAKRQASRERHGRSRLNEAQVETIRRRLTAGERESHLAKEYGVARSTLYYLKTGVTWNDQSPPP